MLYAARSVTCLWMSGSRRLFCVPLTHFFLCHRRTSSVLQTCTAERRPAASTAPERTTTICEPATKFPRGGRSYDALKSCAELNTWSPGIHSDPCAALHWTGRDPQANVRGVRHTCTAAAVADASRQFTTKNCCSAKHRVKTMVSKFQAECAPIMLQLPARWTQNDPCQCLGV